MISEEAGLAVFDAYIRTQLARAAETYASRSDVDARLRAILAGGQDDGCDNTAAADT